MREVFSILFGAAFTVAVAVALGSLLISRLRVALYRTEAGLIAFVAGSACLSFVITLLCFLHVARKGVFQWGGAAAIALAIWNGRGRPKRRELPAIPLTWLAAFWTVFAVFGTWYFVNALAPEISPDGSGYHLGNVARMWRTHGFDWGYRSMYSYLSEGVEVLYLMAFSFGRHSAPALVHLTFFGSLVLLLMCWGRRFGYWKVGLFAAAAVFVSPVVAKDAASAYIDLAVVTVIYAGIYLLQVWDETRESNVLILIGLFSGYAYAAKYTAFLMFPFAVVWVASSARKQAAGAAPPAKFESKMTGQLVMLCLPALLMCAPWIVRNWIWVGNPAAPFLNAWFPNPYYYPGMEHLYAEMLKHYNGIKHFWQVPLELTLRGGLVDGMFGPVFALFPFALFALRLKFGRQLLLAAVVFAIPAYFNVGSRFLIPSLPFLALALGLGVSQIPGALPALALFQVFLCWPTVLSTYCTPWTWRLSEFPLAVALRTAPVQPFFHKWLAESELKAPVEMNVPKGGKVFTFSGRPESYIDRDLVVSYESSLGNLVNDILWAPQAHPPNYQEHFKFLPVTTRAIRVVNMGTSPDFWTVSELRIYSKGRELARSPEWRLSAKPNGWDVQLAFDNSYATRWSSWQPMSPGQWIQVEFPAPVTVDDVVLECDPAWDARPQVEVLRGDGRWAPMTDTMDAVKMWPPEGIRRAAARDVRALGFRYILVNEGDMVFQDMGRYPAYWGVTEIANVNGVHFYRID